MCSLTGEASDLLRELSRNFSFDEMVFMFATTLRFFRSGGDLSCSVEETSSQAWKTTYGSDERRS